MGVQYKKVASLMIISLAIQHADLMSNVEQGIMNVEVRMFLLNCFGANNAHKWNLNRFSFFPLFDIPCSTFDIQKKLPNLISYHFFVLYPLSG